MADGVRVGGLIGLVLLQVTIGGIAHANDETDVEGPGQFAGTLRDDAVEVRARIDSQRAVDNDRLEPGNVRLESEPRASAPGADQLHHAGEDNDVDSPRPSFDLRLCTHDGVASPDCWDLLPSGCPAGIVAGSLVGGEYQSCYMDGGIVVETEVPSTRSSDADDPPPHQVVYSRVVEEFSQLPLNGGRVAFEEQLQGFGYINRHTNVFADVETQTLSVELLGYDVDVRAIPVEYSFDYGDGTTRTSSRPGESAAEFAASREDIPLTNAETHTSHMYTETGVYPVQVTTTFIGEYQVEGSGWIAIPGTATASASPGEADIWRTSQRLVSGSCRATSDYGCNGPFTIEPGDRPPAIYQDRYDDDGRWLGR